ncbi:MAG TPA: hypothetical protein VLG71_01560, partial [Candidatus Limnocylindria bacterium]|nr:hypothetical protein [Candidatus Limnocylindria bacterium]
LAFAVEAWNQRRSAGRFAMKRFLKIMAICVVVYKARNPLPKLEIAQAYHEGRAFAAPSIRNPSRQVRSWAVRRDALIKANQNIR